MIGGNNTRMLKVDAGIEVPPVVQTSFSSRSVPARMQVNLAAELAIHKDDVADGQHHADAPPDQADGQRVRTGDGAGEGDVTISAGGGGQQRGIEPSARPSQHEEQVKAPRQECFDRLSLAIEEPESGQ